MTNALDEMLRVLSENKIFTTQIKCAVIGYTRNYGILNFVEQILNNALYDDEPLFSKRAILPENWDNNQWLRFLEDMRFTYDNGFGSQELYGYIWFNDGSWLERAEYDGSEWWEYKTTPEIPDLLRVKDD